MRCCRISPVRGKLDCRYPSLISGNQVDCPKPDRQRKMGTVQNSSHCDRTLSMAMLTDIFPASAKPITAAPSTFRADKTIRPTLLEQICLAGFLCLEPLPKLSELHPFLRAHLCRHPSLLRLFYHFFWPFIWHYILGLVDLSR